MDCPSSDEHKQERCGQKEHKLCYFCRHRLYLCSSYCMRMTSTAMRNIMPCLVPPSGTQGSGASTKLNARAYSGDAKEQRGSYNLPQRGSDSPRLASSQSRKRGNFKCRYCGRTFVYMTPFIAHEYAHANEKRFLCNFCPQGFVTRQLLTVHLRVHKDEILANDDAVP